MSLVRFDFVDFWAKEGVLKPTAVLKWQNRSNRAGKRKGVGFRLEAKESLFVPACTNLRPKEEARGQRDSFLTHFFYRFRNADLIELFGSQLGKRPFSNPRAVCNIEVVFICRTTAFFADLITRRPKDSTVGSNATRPAKFEL